MVPQHLELLPDLGADVAVVRIDRAQVVLIGVDVVELEHRPPDGIHAPHHLDQPAARVQPLVAKKERAPPLLQHVRLGHELAFAHDEHLARGRRPVETDVAAGTARGGRERRPLSIRSGVKNCLGTTNRAVTLRRFRS